MRYRIRRAKTWHCCVAPLVPRLPSHWSHFRRNPPPSSGVLDCTSSSSFLMFWCVFLKGLCIWEKKSIYFNRYLIFIFYNKLPETGGFFVFIRSQILGEPMLKMYIWMSGKKNVSCLTLPFFMCKEKKDVRDGAGETETYLPRVLLWGKNFYICAKSHEDVHGHARPNLSRRTMLNPSELKWGFNYSSSVK